MNSRWWKVPRPLADPRLRLICLPHAGAGASSYYRWGQQLQTAGVEIWAVQYPGREDRINEAPITSVSLMVDSLADVWGQISGDIPCALFGHSMGALLGFELARELVGRAASTHPCHLFISGINPPHAPRSMPAIHQLPDEHFIQELVGIHKNGLAPEILADREMLSLVTPILKADCTLVASYVWKERTLPNIPFSVFGGTEDPWTEVSLLAEWERYTRCSCHVRMIKGDHFFHQSERDTVVAAVLEDLLPLGSFKMAMESPCRSRHPIFIRPKSQ